MLVKLAATEYGAGPPVAILHGLFGAGRWAIPDASFQTGGLVLATAATGMAYGCLAAVYRASPVSLAVILIIETAGALTQSVGAAFIIVGGGSIPSLLRLLLAVQLAQEWLSGLRAPIALPHRQRMSEKVSVLPALEGASARDMPATPAKVWQAIQSASQRKAAE